MFLAFGELLIIDGRSPGSPAASILGIDTLAGMAHWARPRGSDTLPAEETQESLDQ
jgi:hypothetical protein